MGRETEGPIADMRLLKHLPKESYSLALPLPAWEEVRWVMLVGSYLQCSAYLTCSAEIFSLVMPRGLPLVMPASANFFSGWESPPLIK